MDNSLDPVKKGGDIKAKHLKSQQLKDHHKDLMKKYELLEGKTLEKIRDRSEFVEPKVLQLWTAAKKANFTDVELESFRVSTLVLRICICIVGNCNQKKAIFRLVVQAKSSSF